jgi:hypothetical protein
VLKEFSAGAVTTEVIEHLERRRPAIVADEAMVRAEVERALEPVRREYADSGLPPRYLEALEGEVRAALPTRWRAVAEPFTRLEQSGFGTWRGGDVVARVTYVFVGLLVGGLILKAPFIPIWEKWFPFALAVGAWWLPDLQTRWHRRRYAHRLGEIVAQMHTAQKALDREVTVQNLFPPPSKP